MMKLNWFFYGLIVCCNFLNLYGRHVIRFWDVFNNFLVIDATDRSKISRDQKRFFIALSLYPLSFFANTPFKKELFVFWGHLWTKVCGIVDFFSKDYVLKLKIMKYLLLLHYLLSRIYWDLKSRFHQNGTTENKTRKSSSFY